MKYSTYFHKKLFVIVMTRKRNYSEVTQGLNISEYKFENKLPKVK